MLFRELQASLEKLEMAERAKAVHRRWSAIFNKLLGFNLLYADVREWWDCIEDTVREEARIETNEMRLCIAEFEAPHNTILFFQRQRNNIAAALCSIHQKIVEVNLKAAELMLVDVERDCDLLGAYLFDLRSGFEEIEAIEEQILQGRRTNGQVGVIDWSQKSATTSRKSDSGLKCYSRSRSSDSSVQSLPNADGSNARGKEPVCNVASSDNTTLQQDAASNCGTELEVTSGEEFQDPTETSPVPRVMLGRSSDKGMKDNETTSAVKKDSGRVGGW